MMFSNIHFFLGPLPIGIPSHHKPLPRAKFHVYRGNVSPLRGEKPIFGPLSKNYRRGCATPAGNKIRRITIFNMADGIITPCNVAGGCGMTCHGIRPNVRHIRILHLVSILTISPQSTCHSAPAYEILSKLDHPRSAEKK